MLKRGDIVLLPYPFTDLSGNKLRPALVISCDVLNSSNEDAIFLFITHKEYSGPFDLRVNKDNSEFGRTGLRGDSATFRTSKLATLNQHLAQRQLGWASKDILAEIQKRLQLLLDL